MSTQQKNRWTAQLNNFVTRVLELARSDRNGSYSRNGVVAVPILWVAEGTRQGRQNHQVSLIQCVAGNNWTPADWLPHCISNRVGRFQITVYGRRQVRGSGLPGEIQGPLPPASERESRMDDHETCFRGSQSQAGAPFLCPLDHATDSGR